jgi:hypothetical protein
MGFLERKVYFLIVLLALILIGCASNTVETGEVEQTVPISKTSHLCLMKSWLIKNQGTYLQKIKATMAGKQHTFSVHLTLGQQKLEAIAFNDVYGRLYHLIWTPEKISWTASENISEFLRPEYIIADFLLTHLSLEYLKTALEGAEVREEEESARNVRMIENKGATLRKIYRSTSIGYLWEKITIQNPEVGYELDIETVPFL